MTDQVTGAAVPVLAESMVRAYARQLVDKAGRSRVLALRGDPRAALPSSVTVADGVAVKVAGCVSSLAVREVLAELGDDDYLVIVTDRSPQDLGTTLLAQFHAQTVTLPNTWRSVAQAFDAARVAPDLRAGGHVVADALLRHVPAHGYPAAPAGVVTLDHAMSALSQPLTGIPAVALHPGGLLEWTADQSARRRWREQPPELRAAFRDWVADAAGPVATVALDVAANEGIVDGTTIGLAADVLWPGTGAPTTDALTARARLERFVSGRSLDDATARQLADSARGIVVRMGTAGDPKRLTLLAAAEALLGDVGWPDGALRSSVLPAGYDARLRALASALVGPDSQPFEARMADLLRHESARLERLRDTDCAVMAVRLRRWLSQTPAVVPATLQAAMQHHMDEDSWVDRALADVSAGSSDPPVAQAYESLCADVVQRRRSEDLTFAGLLASATAREAEAEGVVVIEDVVSSVVGPLAAAQPVLLVVIDGMSSAVAAELVDGATELGWREAVPAATMRRLCALPVLPTVTTYSRTSLLTGALRAGTQVDEKRWFPGGGPLFHKDDLRAAAGQALPGPVRDAIAGSQPVVAVVLNTVDDHLAKHDPDGTEWTVGAVQHLRSLLELAANAERTVVLTSDHGHVVERGSDARPAPGADNRWRPVATGPVAGDEVLLAGRRVLAAGGQAIVPAVEGLRYGRKSAGYHGGATAAEATVPVLVLTREPATVASAGWVEAPPQAPMWWNQAVAGASVEVPTPRRAGAPAPRQEESLFEVSPPVPVVSSASEQRLAEFVVASDVYARQHARAGRAAPDDSVVVAVLRVLLAGGGRAHRDTVASAAGVSETRFGTTLAMLRRLLNVEGYDVIGMDPDQQTVVVDVPLLTTQFQVASS